MRSFIGKRRSSVAIYAKDEIKQLVNSGEIIIDPYEEKMVGPASYDLRLDKKLRVFKGNVDTVHVKSDDFDIHALNEEHIIDPYYTLMPGKAILGVTVEKVTLSSRICGWLQGRSRFARLGLMVHMTSSFIQPGVSNKQVLEMYNAGPVPIAIYPNIAICQIIFEEVKGEAVYSGKFKDQTSA